MRKLSKLFRNIFFVISSALSLSGCACNHVDLDQDFKCDKCDEYLYNRLHYKLDANGGACGLFYIYIFEGQKYTLPVCRKDNCKFLYWTLDGNEVPISGKWDYSNSDGTLVAVYEDYYYLDRKIVNGGIEITGLKEEKSSLEIPSYLDGYKVVGISNAAFSYSHFLQSVIIPDTVTYIGRKAFSSCDKLKTIRLSHSISKIEESTFSECSSLTSIEIPEAVAYIHTGAFYKCTSLLKIQIGKSINFIGDDAFSYCIHLQSILLKKSVQFIKSYAFYNCFDLKIYCESDCAPSGWDSNWNPSDLSVKWNLGESFEYDGILYSVQKDNTLVVRAQYNRTINSFTIPQSIEEKNVTEIGDSAFNGSSLKSINLPDTIIRINNRAFFYCTLLESINAPSDLLAIGDFAFYFCIRLTSFEIPDSVYYLGRYAFSNCIKITSIKIPDSITLINYCTFEFCTGLKSIILSHTVTSIDKCAFECCVSLTSIIIPDSVVHMETNVFESCNALSIYCEAPSKPRGWNENWNPSNRPVYWGYTAE